MSARNGSTECRGNVESGLGTVTVGDGVFEGTYSYESRFGEGEGTNPEQPIAAHAACFTMARPNILSTAGHVPDTLRTSARVHLRNIDGAPTLAGIELDAEEHAPGVGQQRLRRYADEAKAACPVSRAVAGILETVLTVKLRMARSSSTDAATRGATG
jgi:lipoyl-dependent peroxiredoxin